MARTGTVNEGQGMNRGCVSSCIEYVTKSQDSHMPCTL
jgi:hypothetical protein